MLSERIGGVGGAFGKIIGELQLAAQGFAGTDGVGLSAFALPDGFRGFEEFLNRSAVDKDAAVVIGENEVAVLDFEIAEARRGQRIGIARIEALRTGGA